MKKPREFISHADEIHLSGQTKQTKQEYPRTIHYNSYKN